jgi:uncharacterized repeat protein (TIGR01451 family)
VAVAQADNEGNALACATSAGVGVAQADGPDSHATAAASGSTRVASASAGETDVEADPGTDCSAIEGNDTGQLLPADVLLSETMSAGAKVGGGLSVITVKAANAGDNTAIDAYIKDLLPQGFEFVDCVSTVSQFRRGFCWWDGESTVVDDFGNFLPGSTAMTQIYVRTTVAGDFLNRAGIGADNYDPESTNNFVDLPVTVAAA